MVRFRSLGYSLANGVRDFSFIAGLALITYGARLVYEPLAYIVPGAILCGLAVFWSRQDKRPAS